MYVWFVLSRDRDPLSVAAPLKTLCARFYVIMLMRPASLPPIHYRRELHDCFLYFPSHKATIVFVFFGRPALFQSNSLAEGPMESARA